MSIVKINAITVPAERADVMAQRFAARAGEVGKSDGFEEFQLLRPNDDRTTWLVYTRWRDEAAFEAWRATQFGPGGGPPQGAGQGPPAGGPGGAPAGGQGGGPAGGQGGGPAQGGAGGHGSAPGGPVATGSELWSFLVEQRETTG